MFSAVCRFESWSENWRLCTTSFLFLGRWHEFLHGKSSLTPSWGNCTIITDFKLNRHVIFAVFILNLLMVFKYIYFTYTSNVGINVFTVISVFAYSVMRQLLKTPNNWSQTQSSRCICSFHSRSADDLWIYLLYRRSPSCELPDVCGPLSCEITLILRNLTPWNCVAIVRLPDGHWLNRYVIV